MQMSFFLQQGHESQTFFAFSSPKDPICTGIQSPKNSLSLSTDQNLKSNQSRIFEMHVLYVNKSHYSAELNSHVMLVLSSTKSQMAFCWAVTIVVGSLASFP